MTNNRLDRVLNLLENNKLDAIALNPSPTLSYLLGVDFHLMERPIILLIAPSARPVLILPELEMVKAKSANFDLKCFAYNDYPETWHIAFEQACQYLQIENQHVGVESNHLRMLELNFLQQAAPDAKFIPAEEPIGQLRIIKDAEEVGIMRQAARIAQQALLATLPLVKPGVTERELAAELVIQLMRCGGDEPAFAPIVSSGPNSANPHATPSDRRIEQGDLLLFDWGARYRGYCSDITRTFVIGEANAQFKQIAAVVAAANAAGRAAGGPGVPAANVDKAARKVIVKAGFGEFFTHRTGHGLGMEGHEYPYMHDKNKVALQPGMTYTVEPGIYFRGCGGVRIEDDVLVTANGVESLTDLPRELIVIGQG